MTKFGLIPTTTILRLGELTKREIVVLCFLYSVRNRDSGRCDPTRAEIGRRVKMAKSHVSTAVKTLEEKGWIEESESGNFELKEPAKGYQIGNPNSYQNGNPKGYQIGNSGLPNRLPKVTKSVTTRNISLNRQITDKGDENPSPEFCVFLEWKNTLRHPLAKPDKKRLARINARLKDGFTVDQLKKVPHGVLMSPWHMGENDRKTKYDGIDTIYRDAAQVEKFLGLAGAISSQPAGCKVCLTSEYKTRMSLKPGEIFDATRKIVTRCECTK